VTAGKTSTARLPRELYGTDEVRALEQLAIHDHGLGDGELMRRAGRAILDTLLAVWPSPGTLHIVCGTGNNGGDGFVVAELAKQRGMPVVAWQVGAEQRIRGDALAARQRALACGVDLRPLPPMGEGAPDPFAPAGVLVDAVLGTGLRSALRAPQAEAVAAINASTLPVLSVDLPSGLCGDTGRVLGDAVRATLTVSLVGLNRGLLTGEGPACSGELRFAALQLPEAVRAAVAPSARRLLRSDGSRWLAPRPRTAHKGRFGHVLVVGGNHGMGGAAMLAAQAAGRVGAGLVSCATRAEHLAPLLARCPEVMAHGLAHGRALLPLLKRAGVGVIGPGLGRDGWAEQLLQAAWHSDLPLVVDADALNLLAAGRAVAPARAAPWLMTPHPGEAGRLLGCSASEVQADRFAAAAELARRFGAGVVLKGAGTLVQVGQATPAVCSRGNPGMGSGGMGDVLSGVLGGLLAQGLPMDVAAELGVCLHGEAGDRAAAEGGERGLLASDLMAALRRLVNEY